ncbi:hypothetical protein PTI97_01390 [Exiguobacterium marinum]|uniref:Uncharacterized protein n=1 Tax=Exiguobacterium marinum TaxID=273528 RepID=A0ABY7WZB1_9BACL|nr:hypothetical protein [Exiguobacterium marinum]WDH76207.1 hypothetical protein PTI97_01390 [Exiguobacterium marinum]
MMLWINILVFPIFLIMLIITLRFLFGKEGKDERGKEIATASYMVAAPIFPIGWLLIEWYHRWLHVLSFDVYRDVISLLIGLTFIVQGVTITVLKHRI